MFRSTGAAITQREFDDAVLSEVGEVALRGGPADAYRRGHLGRGHIMARRAHRVAHQGQRRR
jgi:hypothetical protein